MQSIYEQFLNKYKSYTEIQEKALPITKNRENCLIIAPTGSGKTEAATLAEIDKISRQEDKSGIKLIYITPLRALNRDMINRLEGLCKEVGVTVSVRHGDTSQSERGKQGRKAPMVLITTPETLQSILPTKTIGLALKNVEAVVVDEIHELYSNKRGAQLSIALERLEELAPNFQRIGISATVGDPQLLSTFLCNKRPCKIAQVDKRKQIKISVELPRKHGERTAKISDKFGLDDDALARLDTIARHISESKSTIIFANTRQVVEAVGSRLVYLNSVESFGGIAVHHSSLDRDERIKVENSFKSGEIKAIIATSSLELGIDIGNIDLVMQYGSPRQALRMVQRIGRSGHSEKGVAKGAIITANTVDALEAVSIAKLSQAGALERFNIHKNALDVLANQICGIALDKGIIELEQLHKIITRSFVYNDFPKEKLVTLLAFTNMQKMVGFDGQKISSGARTRMYYYDHLSVIPDSKRYLVKSAVDRRIISTLDEGFVATNVDEGSIFITKGLPWKVLSIDEDVISVEPSSDLEAAVPDWSGEDIPVSYAVAQSVFSTIHDTKRIGDDFTSKEVSEEISAMAHSQNNIAPVAPDKLMIERSDEYTIIHTGLGTLANEALSRVLAHALSAKLGKSVEMKSSPYLIFIEVPMSFNIEQAIKDLGRSGVRKALELVIKDTEIFRYRFITTAKLFGMIERDATVSKSIARRLIKVMQGTPLEDETLRTLMENYFDVETLDEFFRKISVGEILVKSIYSKTLSPFAKTVLDSAYYTKELIMPLLPSDQVIDSFAKFMLGKSMKLLCTYCGFNFSRKLSELKGMNEIKCPNCESPMIAPYDDESLALVEKRKSGKRLTTSEHKAYKEILKQADLMSSYGGKAAIALSTYGVGPTSAARILMMFRRQERLFYMDLIEAQKNFIKNKKYWAI